MGPPWAIEEADLVNNGLCFPCFSLQRNQEHLLHSSLKLEKAGSLARGRIVDLFAKVSLRC